MPIVIVTLAEYDRLSPKNSFYLGNWNGKGHIAEFIMTQLLKAFKKIEKDPKILYEPETFSSIRIQQLNQNDLTILGYSKPIEYVTFLQNYFKTIDVSLYPGSKYIRHDNAVYDSDNATNSDYESYDETDY
jgi:hypothetical protein